jgi:hypothetical protein
VTCPSNGDCPGEQQLVDGDISPSIELSIHPSVLPTVVVVIVDDDSHFWNIQEGV